MKYEIANMNHADTSWLLKYPFSSQTLEYPFIAWEYVCLPNFKYVGLSFFSFFKVILLMDNLDILVELYDNANIWLVLTYENGDFNM